VILAIARIDVPNRIFVMVVNTIKKIFFHNFLNYSSFNRVITYVNLFLIKHEQMFCYINFAVQFESELFVSNVLDLHLTCERRNSRVLPRVVRSMYTVKEKRGRGKTTRMLHHRRLKH